MVRERIEGQVNTLESYKFIEDSDGQVTTRTFDNDTSVLKGGKNYRRVENEALSNAIDGTTAAIQTVSHDHHKIHTGRHFFICGFEAAGSSDEIDFVVTSPNTTEWTHMMFCVDATDGVSMEVYESITHNGNGTTTTPINNNRNSNNTSSLVVRKNPTITDLGTKIFGNSSGSRGAIGAIERKDGIILKQNTDYLYRITSLNVSNTVSYCGSWYEHTDI